MYESGHLNQLCVITISLSNQFYLNSWISECLVCHQSFMRKPLLIAHMRTQQHGEDEFIHNKPDFPEAKDNNNLRTINDTMTTEEDDDANDIIYLSMNDKGFVEDDDVDIDEDDGHYVVSGWVASSFAFHLKSKTYFLPFSHSLFQHSLKEEHIVDESEIIEEEDELIADTQFSGSGNDSNDPTTNAKQFHLIRHRQRQHLSTIYGTMNDGDVDGDDEDDGSGAVVTYIETTEVDSEDPLNLEQICVPVDGDNESWMRLAS